MIFDPRHRRLLLCPPKCASRSARRAVRGQALRGNASVDGEGRHRILRQRPPRWRPTEVWCLTRSPRPWYESWWLMFRERGWALNRAHWPDGMVPTFREAVHRWTHAQHDEQALGIRGEATLVSPSAPEAMLREQALRGCGWWSLIMRWTSEAEPLAWNPDVRWLPVDTELRPRLRAAGFDVDTSRANVGINRNPRPTWDEDMLRWVRDADGPTLELVQASSPWTLEAP